MGQEVVARGSHGLNPPNPETASKPPLQVLTETEIKEQLTAASTINAELEKILFTSLDDSKKAFSDEQEAAPATSAEEATRRKNKAAYMRNYMRNYRRKNKAAYKASKKVMAKEKPKASKKVLAKAKASPKASPKVNGYAATKLMTTGPDQELQ